MLKLLARTAEHASVKSALDDPLLTTASEARLILDILGDELTQEGRNFVHVLAEYDRISLLSQIAETYELMKSNHEKTMDVEVASAFDVEESDLQKLTDALKERLQREINLSATTDPSLLGGVVIRAEDTVIDDSVRGRLNRLSHLLD
jgi:F-type H+-transporting ATPase subunit delta